MIGIAQTKSQNKGKIRLMDTRSPRYPIGVRTFAFIFWIFFGPAPVGVVLAAN